MSIYHPFTCRLNDVDDAVLVPNKRPSETKNLNMYREAYAHPFGSLIYCDKEASEYLNVMYVHSSQIHLLPYYQFLPFTTYMKHTNHTHLIILLKKHLYVYILHLHPSSTNHSKKSGISALTWIVLLLNQVNCTKGALNKNHSSS